MTPHTLIKRLRVGLLGFAAFFTLVATTHASGTLLIERPWARATVPGQSVGAGYLTVINRGRSDDRLLGVTSTVSREVQLHSMSMEGGVMRMRLIEGGVPVASNERVAFEPGGLHLMFIDLKSPLVAGTLVPVTLRFAKAGELRVEFRVESIGK